MTCVRGGQFWEIFGHVITAQLFVSHFSKFGKRMQNSPTILVVLCINNIVVLPVCIQRINIDALDVFVSVL